MDGELEWMVGLFRFFFSLEMFVSVLKLPLTLTGKEKKKRFSSFGDAVPYRPVEDVAFSTARFYQLGGTFQNYYMVLPMVISCVFRVCGT